MRAKWIAMHYGNDVSVRPGAVLTRRAREGSEALYMDMISM
jgi:hypothetical protein